MVVKPLPIRLSIRETSPFQPLNSGNPLTNVVIASPIDALKSAKDPLTLNGGVYVGFCVKAYDGDTCTINIRSRFGDHQWKVRLLGFDSPEMKTKNPIEKKHAIACRDTLLELIGQKYVVVSCGPFEKYGRLLGNIYVRSALSTGEEVHTESCDSGDVEKIPDLLHVNDWMIKHTSSVPYDGGKKQDISYDRNFHPTYMKHVK